jgi:hypothetical protein
MQAAMHSSPAQKTEGQREKTAKNGTDMPEFYGFNDGV